jgi:hypothetical protein
MMKVSSKIMSGSRDKWRLLKDFEPEHNFACETQGCPKAADVGLWSNRSGWVDVRCHEHCPCKEEEVETK